MSKKLIPLILLVGVLVFFFSSLLISSPPVKAVGCEWNGGKGNCDDKSAQQGLNYPLDETTLVMIALAHGRSIVYVEGKEGTPSTLAVVGMRPKWPAQEIREGSQVQYYMSQEGVVGLMKDMGRNFPGLPVNGDGLCQPPETQEITPADCAPVIQPDGNGVCETGQDHQSNPQDCP
jgi:hypothetical protein